jgi:hypothetical protein
MDEAGERITVFGPKTWELTIICQIMDGAGETRAIGARDFSTTQSRERHGVIVDIIIKCKWFPRHVVIVI